MWAELCIPQLKGQESVDLMWNKGPVFTRLERRNIEEGRRGKDTATAATIGDRGWRRQPQKHLLRPFVEVTIWNITKVDTVCRLDYAI